MRGRVRSIGCLCRCLWSCYVVLQSFFIFEGGQFSGLPVLGGSVVMILRNSSRNVVGVPGSIRYPSGVFFEYGGVSDLFSYFWRNAESSFAVDFEVNLFQFPTYV
jgi:hypothetical protein